MTDDPFEVNLAQHLASIRLCLETHLRIPALSLIYVGIDVMANLGRKRGQEQANRHDFAYWSEKYMDCKRRLGVSGLDLFAARCGVVHTYSPDSGLSRTGKAIRIMYSWGSEGTEAPNALLRGLARPEKFVRIDDLHQSFADGVTNFHEVMARNREFGDLVRARARSFFMDFATFPG